MVVKIMGWRPWPPISCSRKFNVSLRVHSLEGFNRSGSELVDAQLVETSNATAKVAINPVLMIQVKWKGANTGLSNRLRSTQKRARTSEKGFEHGRSVSFQEDFDHVCVLAVAKDGGFLPYDVEFGLVQVNTKSKATMLGKTVMNLGELAPVNQEMMKHTKRLPIMLSESVYLQKHLATLVVSIILSDIGLPESGSMVKYGGASSPLRCLSGPFSCDQQIRNMYGKKMKGMRRTVSDNWEKTSGEMDSATSSGKLSTTSEESSSDAGDLPDMESFHDLEDNKLSVAEEDRILQRYGPLVGVNLFVEGAIPKLSENWHSEELVSPCLSSNSYSEASTSEMSASDSDNQTATRRSLLAWKKRKLSFRSKTRHGEPLLNKDYGENGGDDIDRDRRLSGCPIEPCCSPNEERVMLSSAISECLDFEAELFSIGSWEKKDFMSRDGNMALSTSTFFASIDQRSERAAGESACTALVGVIAEWLHQNPNRMPIKAEYDMLIREGSAEWRKLRNVESYRSKFEDGHFDLETVLNARARPLVLDHERSFVGFFQPEGLDDTYNSFLEGAKSFDEIWACIEQSLDLQPNGNSQPDIYIVSWNDHFFLLKVCQDACYIIDTLGERLHEGCKQAYILRFDDDTILSHQAMPALDEPNDGASRHESSTGGAGKRQEDNAPKLNKGEDKAQSSASIDNQVEYKARDACREFVKGFFAALPILELQTDLKKGLLRENALHQRLQIEFHFTSLDRSNAGSTQ